jgi:Fe-S oxidoreductase
VALAAELRAQIRGEVRFDEGSRALYATDSSNYRQVPIGIVIPKDVEDVITTVAACQNFGAALLARGGGTSLAGQCCNIAVVLDPSTHNHCTLGGMIGNDSCGTHSLMAGKTTDNIEELDILTYDGLRLRVGPTSEEDLARIIREGGLRGQIYARLKALRDRYADLIRERYPRIPRRVSGYNLEQLLPENGFHVARALFGSEGTCVTVLEATARLVYSPPARALVVLGYPDVYAAGDAVSDGQSRADLLPKMFGHELVEAFRGFKAIWDPEGKTMCPSFMVTREEEHTTRGRARLLFEMLPGNPLTDGWRDEPVREALDLCLACKGCKGDCPVNVDMATYKAEFLSHYYQGRLRPITAYSMGLISWWARLASHLPGVVNFLTHTPPFSRLAKAAAGIAPERRLPVFAHEPFTQWFRTREPRNVGRPRVLLWPDTFNNYFHPETAIAAVEVLEAVGYQVEVPEHSLCCGRPLYDFGMLELAKRWLRQILETLRVPIAAGLPLVGLEPSCVAVFRDELTNLFPHDEDAKRLRHQSFLLSELLEKIVCRRATDLSRVPLRQFMADGKQGERVWKAKSS